MIRQNNFDWSNNFWKVFPEILTIETFSKLRDKDKSEDKRKSSNIMWSLRMCLTPSSLIYNDPIKWDRVKKSILGDEKFDWEKNQVLIQDYEQLVLTEAEKYFNDFNEILSGKRKFLKEFNWETANESKLKVLESMSTNMFKIGQEFDKVRKLLKEEYAKDDKPKSLLEEGFE